VESSFSRHATLNVRHAHFPQKLPLALGSEKQPLSRRKLLDDDFLIGYAYAKMFSQHIAPNNSCLIVVSATAIDLLTSET